MSLMSQHARQKKIDMGLDVHHGWDSVIAFLFMRFLHFTWSDEFGDCWLGAWVKANGFCQLT